MSKHKVTLDLQTSVVQSDALMTFKTRKLTQKQSKSP